VESHLQRQVPEAAVSEQRDLLAAGSVSRCADAQPRLAQSAISRPSATAEGRGFGRRKILGERTNAAAGAMAYCDSAPFRLYPKLVCLGQKRSRPDAHHSQAAHVVPMKVMPTRPPVAHSVTPAPSASTRPMPSWPSVTGAAGSFSRPAT